MANEVRRLLPDTLLARTFLLIAALLLVAVVAWFEIIRSSQREPLANELAEQTISVVNLTRAAIVNADPLRRRGLLVELNEREGIRIYTANAGEKLEALPREPLIDLVAARVKRALGERTRLAFARDGVESFWVSFFIDEDEFWVALPRERFETDPTWQWLGGVLALARARPQDSSLRLSTAPPGAHRGSRAPRQGKPPSLCPRPGLANAHPRFGVQPDGERPRAARARPGDGARRNFA